MPRDRDMRNAIRDALDATGAFAVVSVSGSLPEDQGLGASELTAAIIQPDTDTWQGGWDAQPEGLVELVATAIVTVLVRHEDPQARDERAEQLVMLVANAVNGAMLVPGYNVPGKTRVQRWRWQPARPPERRIAIPVQWTYLVDGWQEFDTSD